MKIKSFFNSHGKQIVILITITVLALIALKYEIDTKMVVFGTVILGVFTQAFAGVAALIATLPVVGPLIVKLFTIPIFPPSGVSLQHKKNIVIGLTCLIEITPAVEASKDGDIILLKYAAD